MPTTSNRNIHSGVLFAVIFVVIFLLHARLLQLPYFWDEAGYYIPAARDIFLTGSLIPHSTVSNAHPPLVMAWIALWWKLFGFAALVTRTAMLVIAAFSLLGVYRLAARVANSQVAITSVICTAVYPVFFAQSSLAHVDLAAAGLTFWAISEYIDRHWLRAAFWFSLAVLAKETAVLAPLALAAWELMGIFARRYSNLRLWRSSGSSAPATDLRRIGSLLLPVIALAVWYIYHFARTGYVFGNPEFFRYNVAATFNAERIFLALLMRLWQVLGYMHLWILTIATLLAMWLLPPLQDAASDRRRIPFPTQMLFYVVIAAYVIAMAFIGGAVLARYMLTAVPLVIILCASTLWRRVDFWRAAIACVALAFVAGWFLNPNYGFSPEDNIAYRDYVRLHEDAEHFLEARYPTARVLTSWPASDEITRPWLGYITRPMRIVRVEDFSLDQMLSAAEYRGNYEVALVFSTKYEPSPEPWDHWQKWNELKSRFFGFHRDLPPEAAARLLDGKIVFSQQHQGQWVAIIEMNRDEIERADLKR